MTEIEAELVRRKLARIRRNLDELEPIAELSLGEYRTDLMRRKAVERLLQEAIEAAVDVNLHLLRALDRPTPPDYYESFVALGRTRVLSAELADRLAPAAGLRNRLVHEYDEIDDEKVLEAVRGARGDFTSYVRSVMDFLAARGH